MPDEDKIFSFEVEEMTPARAIIPPQSLGYSSG